MRKQTRIRNLTDEPRFNGHPILTDNVEGHKCDKGILKTIDNTFEHVIKDHGQDRIFCMRYDVRFPKDYRVKNKKKSEEFRSFQAKFIKNLTRKGLNPHYIAVKEVSKEKRGHYHAALLLDERETQNIQNHIATADRLWANTLGVEGAKGLIDDCTKNREGKKQKNGHTIKVNSPEFKEQLNVAFQQASYLSKENQKSKNDGVREVFSSRLNHEPKKKKGKSK
jgi:protein GP2